MIAISVQYQQLRDIIKMFEQQGRTAAGNLIIFAYRKEFFADDVLQPLAFSLSTTVWCEDLGMEDTPIQDWTIS